MISGEAQPPKWFTDKKIDYPNDAKGWLNELERISDLLNPSRNKWREEWGGIIPEIDKAIPAVISPPAVEKIDDLKEVNRQLHTIEQRSILLRIQLDAPDKTIIDGVKVIVLNARKKNPAPVQRPGPPATNAHFDKTKFASWERHKIIELGKLLAWKKQHKQGKVNKAQIGRWLYPPPMDPVKSVANAERVLKAALKSIRPLDMQIVVQTLKPEKSVKPKK